VKRFLLSLGLLIVGVAVIAGTGLWWWSQQPLGLPSDEPIDLRVVPGSGARGVAAGVVRAGVKSNETLLHVWLRLSGKADALKAGTYEIEPGDTPAKLVDKIVSGRQSLRSVTFIEGWNIWQLRAALAKAPLIKNDSAALSDAELMARLGRPGMHPEGRFFPDTYRYAKGASDLTVLRAAMDLMDKQLAAAWDARASELPLKSADELLIMASIVEKETGAPSDRPLISGVFANRLRIGMKLQTDPTVIYGLGEKFDGDIKKRDLTTDTPYNSYTRAGLPPTPISMPGKASLLSAAQPASTKALYFVARGDGTSQFSETLAAHNAAVQKYILNR
jgi:UPF0755 protein